MTQYKRKSSDPATTPTLDIWQDYTPTPHQQDFHQSTARFRLMKGGYGSGKTFACCKELMKMATRQGGNHILVGRKHFRVLRDTTQRTFRDAISPIEDKWIIQWSHTRNSVTVRATDGGTSQIQFMDLEDPQKLRSLEIGAFFVDEASEITEDTFLTLISRMRLKNIKNRCGILATNPTTKEHWLFKRFAQQQSPDYALFTSSVYDNPHLDKETIRSMEDAFDPERRKRYLHGEWGFCAVGDPVFPSFTRSKHLEELPVIPNKPLVLGWDFGFRRPAAVLGQVQGETLYILDAILGRDQSLDSFADQVMRRVQELTPDESPQHFGDIAGSGKNQVTAESCFERLWARGIPIQGKTQRIDDGLTVIRARLEQLRANRFALSFSRDCHPLLLEAMDGGYHYGDSTSPLGEFQPEKDGLYDHLVDALRYLTVGLFGTSGLRTNTPDPALLDFLDDREIAARWW